MRVLIGFGFAAAAILVARQEARAQAGYLDAAPPRVIYPTAPVAGVTPPGAYAFKNEPVMSVNNSYLGYSNFVDPTYPIPRYILGRSPAQGVTRQPRARLFGWRRRSGQ